MAISYKGHLYELLNKKSNSQAIYKITFRFDGYTEFTVEIGMGIINADSIISDLIDSAITIKSKLQTNYPQAALEPLIEDHNKYHLDILTSAIIQGRTVELSNRLNRNHGIFHHNNKSFFRQLFTYISTTEMYSHNPTKAKVVTDLQDALRVVRKLKTLSLGIKNWRIDELLEYTLKGSIYNAHDSLSIKQLSLDIKTKGTGKEDMLHSWNMPKLRHLSLAMELAIKTKLDEVLHKNSLEFKRPFGPNESEQSTIEKIIYRYIVQYIKPKDAYHKFISEFIAEIMTLKNPNYDSDAQQIADRFKKLYLTRES